MVQSRTSHAWVQNISLEKRMDTILVAVDFSDATPRVVETGRWLAKAFGARIVLLNVAAPEPGFVGYDAGPVTVRQDVASALKTDHQRLEELKQTVAVDAVEVLALHIQGPTVEKILHEAVEQKVSWIVMGSHGHGALRDLLVGSVTHGVLKGAPCPVVVVPAKKPES